ncbi:hypothetical protein ANN_10713 [Periplaneta americana]|uniref:Uncharacterized protein n=1 Tax=Periplaneta americana TaxID=6978 RepID=A0ABQ8T4E5_PERAM|nr:hypothetical protein ANN_10713 [Periplaneta americana]
MNDNGTTVRANPIYIRVKEEKIPSYRYERFKLGQVPNYRYDHLNSDKYQVIAFDVTKKSALTALTNLNRRRQRNCLLRTRHTAKICNSGLYTPREVLERPSKDLTTTMERPSKDLTTSMDSDIIKIIETTKLPSSLTPLAY